ncbi:hypothetical protein Tco_0981650 [Tanacetum coccineum]
MRASSGGDRRQYDHRRIELEVYFEDEGLVRRATMELMVLRMRFPTPRGVATLGLLKNNQDVFAWQPSDMTGVPGRIIEHNLVSIQPVSQKRRVVLAPERSEAVTNEVAE